MFDNSEIGLYFETSSLESFLNTGMVLESFKRSGKTPVLWEVLKIIDKGMLNKSLNISRNLVGKPFGPDPLPGLRVDITIETSLASKS